MTPIVRWSGLAGLPAEILLEIYQYLDLNTIYRFSMVDRSFFDFFQRTKSAILLPALIREFSPFDELLQVYTASASDITTCKNKALYEPRRIVFRQFPDGHKHVLALGPRSSDNNSAAGRDGFTKVTKGRGAIASHCSPSTIVLTEYDLNPILKQCLVVRAWEDLFPQMRWFHVPEDCRSLRPHEMIRFRRALYRWWLYGIYFHGDLPRPRVGVPSPFVDDVRTSQMRHHSTGELLELMDFIETMKDVVLHYICPRLDPNQYFDDPPPLMEDMERGQSLNSSWNDQSRWGRIVKTYVKLGPEEIMHFFNQIYSYSRERLITAVRLQRPNITFDQETIQLAIRSVLDERQMLDRISSSADDSAGGIVDFDDERDDERAAFADDASPTGSLPAGLTPWQSSSRYSPRGDDGSYLEGSYGYQTAGRNRWYVDGYNDGANASLIGV